MERIKGAAEQITVSELIEFLQGQDQSAIVKYDNQAGTFPLNSYWKSDDGFLTFEASY